MCAANKNDLQAKFFIYLWNPVTNTSKMDKFVTIGSIKNVQETTLGDIRKKLISEKAFSWRQKSSEFCNAVGAEVDDSLRFDMYLDFLHNTETEGEAAKEADEGESANKGKKGQQPVRKEDSSGHSFKVYLKLRKLANEMDQETQEFLKEKLAIELKRPDLLEAGSKILGSSYDHRNFMAAAGKSEITHPAEMGEKEWYIVLQNNSVLHGNYVRQLSTGERRVERAMYPALTLKTRQFHDFEVVFSGGSGASKVKETTTSKDPAGEKSVASKTGNASETPVMHKLRIPRFLVQDNSYVSVSENKSSVANAIADSSLAEHSAEFAVGGGAFGVSAGVKVGYKSESTDKTASNSLVDKKRMTITYNFPRVVLELDGESVELSDECQKDLAVVTTQADVKSFKKKYGTFVATRVELGGRLHSTEESNAFSQESVEEKASSLKIAAAASFSYGSYAQGSVSGEKGDATNHLGKKSSSGLSNSLTWEAKGGDTLLCNNPPAWCSTVGSYYNWRVVKQEDLVSIEEMISMIAGYADVKQKFLKLDPPAPGGNKLTTTPAPKPLPKMAEGWVEFWLKSVEDDKFVTAMPENPFGNITWVMNPTPSQNKGMNEINRIRSLKRSVEMTPSAAGKSQCFTAGCKHYEIWDEKAKTFRKRLRIGGSYIWWSMEASKYAGATLPCEGLEPRSYTWVGAEWAESCYFQFVHVTATDKLHIDHDDAVRVQVSDTKGNFLGYLRNMPPLGVYGETGDIFRFQYAVK
ncbi:hypothetical protein ASPWEDRAFT_55355 [Aspergillus wentii DTO 134E9]|uniref:MACPF-like domain-containing protein n=1 Tax=Aspergillus wentii DTO 134E9 TaxID=1073089 RepID=A0A1L9R4E2_ASPWE|nr:uncharacterized protein ASPWEDRAFT_55355 [Aspergillus wentii DTO 134E9]OJJ29789.1 hypothetical protein ASPWEDRAFT_55355 [Aspergillus wentii DTO 134E9]